jgi:hypothetical protein
VEVLLCIIEDMGLTASCLPKDICCRWYLALDGAAASVAAETGFVVVATAVAAKAHVLRAHALLVGDFLWLAAAQLALLFLA